MTADPAHAVWAPRGRDAVTDTANRATAEPNKALVLEYMEAFGTFDPANYGRYLTKNPPTRRA
jgi:hypothetical protein